MQRHSALEVIRISVVFLVLILAGILSSFAEYPTTINGQYYLRGMCPDGYEFCGTGYDIGQITRNPPMEDGERNCGSWILFGFKPTGFFPDETTQVIESIYFHIWWRSDDGFAFFGYDSIGSKGNQVDQKYAFFSETAQCSADSYHLAVFRSDIQPEFGVYQGDAIMNMTLKLMSDLENPSIRSSPRQSSFIIINPKSDEVLRSRDRDNDGLTDYDEMYVYYTDPCFPDTDADGHSDFEENILNPEMSALDPQDPPVFGRAILHEMPGTSPCGYLGSSIEVLGDMDGDDLEEIAIGEPGQDRVRLMSFPFQPRMDVTAPIAGIRFGTSIAAIRDSNGNCIRIAVGAPGWNDDTGIVYFFDSNGQLTDTLEPLALGMLFGEVLEPLDDVNGDGISDLAVGAPGACRGNLPGYVAVFSGADGTLIQHLVGQNAGDAFGSAISGFPDGPDPDVFPEILVGAPCDSRNGRTSGTLYLFRSDGSLEHVWNGEETRTKLGCAVSCIGDYNGDGVSDIAVSAPYNTTVSFPTDNTEHIFECGKIWILSGAGYERIIMLSANTPGDWLGKSLCVIPDVNGDGLDDIVATTGRHRLRDTTVVILTSDNRLHWRCITRPSRNWLNQDLVTIPDKTGDGLPEFILGLPNDRPDVTLPEAGCVMVISTDTDVPDYCSSELNPSEFFFDPDGDPLTYETITLSTSG
ncbi:MAG TPA: hypothetical protein PLV45_15005, partial [bacterium]|nr:hypothetical protein [bacterium]